jgi:filamentous hemagglutinin
MPAGIPTSEDLARSIAHGHAYPKHVVQGGEYPGVASITQFAQIIQETIENASAEKPLSKGRYAWWDDSLRTVVIFDPHSGDLGTAFRPIGGKSYFDNLR